DRLPLRGRRRFRALAGAAVALRTDERHVSAGERERRAGMIEACERRPCGRAVAALTLRRELSPVRVAVARGAGSFEPEPAPGVVAHLHLRDDGRALVLRLMAGAALEPGMRALEGVSRSRMGELRGRPSFERDQLERRAAVIGMTLRTRLRRDARVEPAARRADRRDLAETGEAAVIHACARSRGRVALEAVAIAFERSVRARE